MLGQVKDRDATVFVEERYQAPGKRDKEIESEIYKLWGLHAGNATRGAGVRRAHSSAEGKASWCSENDA